MRPRRVKCWHPWRDFCPCYTPPEDAERIKRLKALPRGRPCWLPARWWWPR